MLARQLQTHVGQAVTNPCWPGSKLFLLSLMFFSPQLLVLKYVQNKDVFMRYHKAHLTRRLILDTSADNEKEENMVEWLRVS